MIIRGGQPFPVRGTAPAVPGAAVQRSDNSLQEFVFFSGKATTWLRIKNTGANPLRVFFAYRDVEGIAPASWKHYIEIPVISATEDGVVEGLFELEEMSTGALVCMGVGGTTTFEALLGLRVV